MRTRTVVSETGYESEEEYAEEVEEETLLKYVPNGNHKWYVFSRLFLRAAALDLHHSCRTTFEVDSTNPQAPTLKVELFVNGKLNWE